MAISLVFFAGLRLKERFKLTMPSEIQKYYQDQIQ